MSNSQQTKVPMHAVKVSADTGASQGARRATEDAPVSVLPPLPPGSNSEVVPRARRRSFTNADRRRILQAADLCTKPGEVGALMRREGVYSSLLAHHCRVVRKALFTSIFEDLFELLGGPLEHSLSKRVDVVRDSLPIRALVRRDPCARGRRDAPAGRESIAAGRTGLLSRYC